MSQTIEKRFWGKVLLGNSCCEWQAAKDAAGYGRFQIGTNQKSKVVLAHRWAYEWYYGSIPKEMQLDHLCHTPACVRPDHLEAVTQAEHNLRRVQKLYCKRGHELFGENMASYNGGRHCRTCNRDRSSDWHKNHKQ